MVPRVLLILILLPFVSATDHIRAKRCFGCISFPRFELPRLQLPCFSFPRFQLPNLFGCGGLFGGGGGCGGEFAGGGYGGAQYGSYGGGYVQSPCGGYSGYAGPCGK
ncbi:hypothetical protein PMAYCL1PPCAC_13160 [Pristionchus mayeri]|uniref:Uncharacterized protein n=1 Tax=Pristionchus mayeri TaxID=1317129 RepID=A0AAN5CEN8_9BILA|nr:hypothetical protein PMAYCL1PPCAC_13160 [Pristionchus mayeri]